MLLSLALKNIKEKKLRTFLASLSITIGVSSLVLFMGLANGIKTATFLEMEKSSPLTQITVRPNTDKTGIISFLAPEENQKLTTKTLEDISKISGVEIVFPEIQFDNFASIEASLLGFSLVTDSMIFGLEEKFIESDLKKGAKWDTDSEPYPAIVPRKIVDMYNYTIASPQGLPLISEESLLGKKLLLYPNYSTFFPGLNKKTDTIDLEVVGFSDKVNLIGVTLPTKIVRELNSKYSNTDPADEKYIELFVITQAPEQTEKVATEIEKLGYKTQYIQKNLKDVEAKFDYLTISLGTISLIILLTSSIAIISTFLATIAERRKEIGLFRALGAKKSHIKKIILTEAGIIGLFGSVLGAIIALASSGIIDTYGLSKLENTTFLPDTLFNINAGLIVLAILFGGALSLFSAYIPARQASSLNPIESLTK